jgi:hypothetical protein
VKINIAPYRPWVGPYQIAEKILFWKDRDDDAVFAFGDWLDKYTPIARITQWFFSKRKIDIRIDTHDTWSMDHTLGLIILPMLKQLKETKHGSPFVDDVDVPEELQYLRAPKTEDEHWAVNYDHDKKEGLLERWYCTGIRQETCMFLNDKKHGIYRGWYLNGRPRELTHYVNGKKHGVHIVRDEDGEYTEAYMYIDDCIDRVLKYEELEI